MRGETLELWQQLCQQAAVEQDTDKLMKLVEKINRLLNEKEQRLRGDGSPHQVRSRQD